MPFEVTTIEVIQYTSYTINSFIALSWGSRKLFLNKYLPGRWKGHLVDNKDPNFVIDCLLYIHNEHNCCNGLLLYKTKINGNVTDQGVDKLIHYKDKEFIPYKWHPTFERVFHIHKETNELLLNNATYKCACKIENRWLNNRLYVSIKGDNRTLEGYWHKQ